MIKKQKSDTGIRIPWSSNTIIPWSVYDSKLSTPMTERQNTIPKFEKSLVNLQANLKSVSTSHIFFGAPWDHDPKLEPQD